MLTVARGNTITLELVVEPVTPEGPVPTMSNVLVDVLNPSAVEVVTDGVATEDADPPEEGTARWTYDYAVAEDAPTGTWTAHWTATVNGEAQTVDEEFEVLVGLAIDEGHYFTLQEGRDFRGGKLANETKFPDADIIAARAEVEEFIEKVCERAFVVRTKTVQIDGSGTSELALPDLRVNAITAVTVTDSTGTETIYDATALADLRVTDYGFLRRKSLGYFTQGYGNVEVTYTYGVETPLPIKRAALILLVNRLIPSDISDRAQSFVNESGTLSYSSANGNKPTGLPEVDAILAKYSDNRVSIA